MNIVLVAAIGENNVIGREGQLGGKQNSSEYQGRLSG